MKLDSELVDRGCSTQMGKKTITFSADPPTPKLNSLKRIGWQLISLLQVPSAKNRKYHPIFYFLMFYDARPLITAYLTTLVHLQAIVYIQAVYSSINQTNSHPVTKNSS
jgi:hypothetical protein